MNYAPVQQINTARHIVRSAQRLIKDKTGMKVTLMLCPRENIFRTPEQMLQVIAIALDMSPNCYRMKSRMRNIAELRFLGAMLLRINFPRITLHQIAALFGGQDHSSILNGLSRAHDLLHTGDPRFLRKYNQALNSVNQWLRKEA